jgi:LuxR family maltose regulon positive regulatory protein
LIHARPSGVPVLPDPLIERPRLLHRLDEIRRRPFTVVSAPAGTGKSVAVAHWCQLRAGATVVWIDLLPGDDVQSLPAGVAAALAQDREQQAPGGPAGADASLDERLRTAPDTVLVIDGADSPEAMAAAMAIAEIVDATASAVRVVAIGRCAPSPMLAAMRVSGRAWQLGMPELSLSDDELVAIVARYSGHDVDDGVAADLGRRLGGWMAAAVLVGLSHPGGRCTVEELLGAARETLEAYVDTTLVAPLADDVRRFVLDTAVTETLSAELCDRLSDGTGADRTLDRLRIDGFPVTRAVSGRLSYLSAVRSALDALAQRRDPGRHASRLRIAADWFAARQMPFEAAGCLVRLAAWDEVVGVITRHLPQILRRDEVGRLADLVRLAPPEVIREQSILALAGAWVLRMDGKVAAAEELLAVYEPYMSERGRMIADVSRAGVASWVEDMDGAASFAETALAACDRLGDDAFDEADSPFPSTYGETRTDEYRALARAAARLACAYGGMWTRGAEHVVDIAADTAARMPQFQLVYMRGATATFFALSGRAADALLEAYTAVSLAEQMQLLDHRMTADAHYALGEALRLSLRHDEAIGPLRRAERLAALNGRRNLVAAAVAAQAHIDVDNHRPDEALRRIAECRRQYPYRYPRTVAGQVSAAEGRALVASGRFSAALGVVRGAPLTSPVAAVRVAVQVALGDVAGAQATVRDWPGEPTVDATVRRALAAAVICEHTGDRQRVALVRAALDAATPHRLAQPFVVYGPLAGRLLRQRVVGDDEFARGVHQWIAEHAPTSTTRLTGREAIVMSYIADGLNLPQVADALNVSVNTIRSHAQAIYRKLGVDNRTDAINAWRARADHSGQ